MATGNGKCSTIAASLDGFVAQADWLGHPVLVLRCYTNQMNHRVNSDTDSDIH